VLSPLGTSGEYSSPCVDHDGCDGSLRCYPILEGALIILCINLRKWLDPDGAFDFNESQREQRLRGAANASRRDFQLGKSHPDLLAVLSRELIPSLEARSEGLTGKLTVVLRRA